MKGDKEYNISTFASKRGVKFTARAACAVLALNYVSAIVQGVMSPGESPRRRFLGTGYGTEGACLLYTSPSPRDKRQSRMPSSA